MSYFISDSFYRVTGSCFFIGKAKAVCRRYSISSVPELSGTDDMELMAMTSLHPIALKQHEQCKNELLLTQ